MPRDISAGMLTPLLGNNISPAFLVQLAFKTQTVFAWTGVGDLVFNGNTYLGVGDLGEISPVVEGTTVQADGMNLTLSGIDNNLLSECLTDIQLGAPVTVSLAFLDGNGNIFGTPFPCFVGQVDQPKIEIGMKTLSITLALESKLSDLGRANQRRYTSADQEARFPGDTICFAVEYLNDMALHWAT